MAHVGIQRFSPGHYQEHGAKNRKTGEPVVCEERECMTRIERAKHGWCADDPDYAERCNRHEPDNDDWAEESADTVRPVLLDAEQRYKNRNGDRHHIRPKQWRHDFKTFYGAEYGDGWRDHPVAVQQSGSEDAERDQHGSPDGKSRRHAAFAASAWHQRGQRQDAAFALII